MLTECVVDCSPSNTGKPCGQTKPHRDDSAGRVPSWARDSDEMKHCAGQTTSHNARGRGRLEMREAWCCTRGMKPLLGGVLEMTRGRETGKADAEYWYWQGSDDALPLLHGKCLECINRKQANE